MSTFGDAMAVPNPGLILGEGGFFATAVFNITSDSRAIAADRDSQDENRNVPVSNADYVRSRWSWNSSGSFKEYQVGETSLPYAPGVTDCFLPRLNVKMLVT